MIKTLLIFFAAVLLTILTARYLLNVEAAYTALLSDDKEQHKFTHEFEDFTLNNTDVNGKLESVIYSPHTYLDTSDQITVMETPQIEMTDNQGSPINITAHTAEVFHQDNITLLTGDVRVKVMNEQNIEMSTDKLTLDHSLQLASTEHPATITHDKGIMHGTGLEFTFDASRVKFLANVRGTYEF